MPDKFAATWVSHTSIADFLTCPRAYYLKNIYRTPETHKKVQLMSPPLALGQIVHEVIEALSVVQTDKRRFDRLIEQFEQAWKKVVGKKGGFDTQATEEKYKEQGRSMLRRVIAHPGPVARLAVKIKADLPFFWLSEEQEIILCGKIDWLEYFPETKSVHIIDFKTGKNIESQQSLQLPIYLLLATNCQSRPVTKASYWYLAQSDELVEKQLPDLQTAHLEILTVAKKIKLARQLERFVCPKGSSGCFACKPFESILRGEAEFVGINSFGQEIYVNLKMKVDEAMESEIL